MFNQLVGTPAPVPTEGLAASLAEFGRSRLLPPAAYTDPAVFAWEQADILNGWSCVGSAADLPRVGSQRSVRTGAGGVLLDVLEVAADVHGVAGLGERLDLDVAFLAGGSGQT